MFIDVYLRKQKISQLVSAIKKAYKFISCTNKKYIIVLLLLQLAGAITTPFLTIQYQEIINSVVNISNYKPFLSSLLIYIALEISIEIIGNIDLITRQKFHFELSNSINTWNFNVVKKIPLEEFEKPRTCNTLNRMQTEFTQELEDVLFTLLSVLYLIVSILVYAIELYNTFSLLPLLIAIGNLPILIQSFIYNKHQREQQIVASNSNRKANYYLGQITDRNSIKYIRTLHLNDFFWKKFWTNNQRSIEARQKNNIIFLKRSITSSAWRKSLQALCLLITTSRILDGKLSIGTFAMVYTAVEALNGNIGSLVAKAGALGMFSLQLDDADYLSSLCNSDHISESFDKPISKVELIDVNYIYPNSKKQNLTHINASFEVGKTTLLVGKNGSGKTTLLYSIAGLSAYSGTIKINDRDIKSCIESYQKKVSMSFCPFNKFPETLQENIFLDRPASNLGNTLIDNLIRKLPKGLHTKLGQLESEGIDLSGGEWKAIVLERTINKSDADIYLFDEPLENLDPLKCDNAINEIIAIGKEHILIVILHELKYANLFDNIIVMDNGQIVESGNFSQLISQKGTFYELYSYYKDTSFRLN